MKRDITLRVGIIGLVVATMVVAGIGRVDAVVVPGFR